MAKLNADDKRWRAESDASMLAEVEEIQRDRPRLEAAKKAAKRLADEAEKRVQGLKKVAKFTVKRSK